VGLPVDSHGPDGGAVIRTAASLEQVYDRPLDVVRRKQLSYLDRHCRKFIELSPLVFLSTSGRGGTCDVTPRGDPPGFVLVVDQHTLLLPDRKGNNRLDSLHNVLENPNVGLVFVIPGINEVLRVNGSAQIAGEPERLAPMAVRGRAPLSALLIKVHEAYLHCGRAFSRAHVWDPERFVSRSALPPLSEMLADHSRATDHERLVLREGEDAELY
jgi:PPOX class probable FMN-dependent enzyme